MKLLGFFLVTAGFLAGAYYLTGAGGRVIGAGFVVSFAVALLGVVVLRVSVQKRKGAREKVTTEVKTSEQNLFYLVEGVEKLINEKNEIDVYDLPQEIDRRFNESIEQFVAARESLAIAYGLPAYAKVMSHFAAGERYLNRVWSCSVDGYIDEAHAYLEHARNQFAQGYAALKHLVGH